MKTIYDYKIEIKNTVIKTVTEEKRRKNKETGEFEKVPVEVEKEVEESEVYEVAIKRPTRREMKEADVFYSIKLNGYIKKGILTQKQVFNTYMDNGGILSEAENKEEFESILELNEIKRGLEKLSIDGFIKGVSDADNHKEDLITKQRELYDKIYELELQKDSIFSNSADNMARNDLIEWWILNLTKFRKGEEGEYSPMFAGKDHEERYDDLCKKEEDKDELYSRCIGTAASVVTLWAMSGTEDLEDFKAVLYEDE
tara:strand:+ start:40831 stop:41598 length:768 start_codon:yes stop_codon:yes gene_type:complete